MAASANHTYIRATDQDGMECQGSNYDVFPYQIPATAADFMARLQDPAKLTRAECEQYCDEMGSDCTGFAFSPNPDMRHCYWKRNLNCTNCEQVRNNDGYTTYLKSSMPGCDDSSSTDDDETTGDVDSNGTGVNTDEYETTGDVDSNGTGVNTDDDGTTGDVDSNGTGVNTGDDEMSETLKIVIIVVSVVVSIAIIAAAVAYIRKNGADSNTPPVSAAPAVTAAPAVSTEYVFQ